MVLASELINVSAKLDPSNIRDDGNAVLISEDDSDTTKSDTPVTFPFSFQFPNVCGGLFATENLA